MLSMPHGYLMTHYSFFDHKNCMYISMLPLTVLKSKNIGYLSINRFLTVGTMNQVAQ